MTISLQEITKISIYLKERAKRLNELVLFPPLDSNLPNLKRKGAHSLRYKFHRFLFRYLPILIPSDRVTTEAQFKTVVALLLMNPEGREYFLGDFKKQKAFYAALEEAALACNVQNFSPTKQDTPLKISQDLTCLKGLPLSLIEDPAALNLQIALIDDQSYREILFQILSRVERSPITAVLEITLPDIVQSTFLSTCFAQYKISDYDLIGGRISYSFAPNRATSSIRTVQNILPNAKGAINQHSVHDLEDGNWIGSYCGELSTPFHVLEQILLVLNDSSGEVYLLDHPPSDLPIQEKKIFFTSFYAWYEFEPLTEQWASIRKWDQKILKCGNGYYKLNLLYFNIPIHAKYPTPGETKASMHDINDEAIISLTAAAWKKLRIEHEELMSIAARAESLRALGDNAFLERERSLLEEIDAFSSIKGQLINQLEKLPHTHFLVALKALLSEKKRDGQILNGMDHLLHLDYVVRELGYSSNKNCQSGSERLAKADATDKAQHSYQKMRKSPFLPGSDSEEEGVLFKVLYNMYLATENKMLWDNLLREI